ncbi:thioredoxin family protein [Streptomyces sp. NPDC046977]|uniref:thioredoxin family protein n=1 Tax=Streptomyces sp. NPDC046977 TaxID=3154703 RepID=UPI0033DE04E3
MTATETGPGHLAEATDATFAAEVLAAGVPVLVEFGADWCPPCRQIEPVLRELAREEEGRLKVVRLDVDHSPSAQSAYGVLSVPTLMVFRDGEPVWSAVGARTGRRLREELAGLL